MSAEAIADSAADRAADFTAAPRADRRPAPKVADAPAARRASIEALDREIVSLAARINAATYDLLVLIRRFDERAGWLGWGFERCADWLHWRCDISLSAAREKVRVAHALKTLPSIGAAFANGELSYSKVRALTRVAGPANERELLRFALGTTAARVEERCRELRCGTDASTDDALHAYARRALILTRDPEHGTVTITVELPAETGELVDKALDRVIEAMVAESQSDESQSAESQSVAAEAHTSGACRAASSSSSRAGSPSRAPTAAETAGESWRAQRADALVELAKVYLSGKHSSAAGRSADHYQVTVHVDEATLRGGVEPLALPRSALPIESVRRLACDGTVVAIVEDTAGEPLSVGRRTRVVPAAIRRALWARDRGCRFPGCGRTRFVDAHHVEHWSAGGATSLPNLILLCGTHHRLVHEGRFRIEKDYRDRWFFRRPDGRAVPACGYRPEDIADIGVDAGAEHEHFAARPSAEASMVSERPGPP